MELDLEQIAVLLQRRYNILREIRSLTEEMAEAVSRQDEVSLSLLLRMRAEELAKYDASQEELWSQAEKGYEAQAALKRLLRTDPEEAEEAEDPMEETIYGIRRKMILLIHEIQERDQILSRHVTGRR